MQGLAEVELEKWCTKCVLENVNDITIGALHRVRALRSEPLVFTRNSDWGGLDESDIVRISHDYGSWFKTPEICFAF